MSDQKLGLSPQVRGKPGQSEQKRAALGSIPAGTGETSGIRQGYASRGVYPRRYGGNNPLALNFHVLGGLSPQVRGKQIGYN